MITLTKALYSSPSWWPHLIRMASESAMPGEGPYNAASPGTPRGCILVIDDDLAIRDMVAELLDFEGYQVATAANGAEGLRLVRLLHPSVILLDMRMPVLDGWGFARAMARVAPEVPIVVMTAAQDARAWATEIGAAAYIAKPFDIFDLLDIVARFLR